MSDLGQKLVGALEGCVSTLWGLSPALTDDGCYTDDPKEKAARAALSAAKDGGWVAVPVEPTQAMLDAADKVQDGCNFGLDDIYKAMLAARPLPNPPKGEV